MNERADIAQNAVFGMLADGARVNDYNVRALFIIRHRVAHLREHPAYYLAVGFVLLTAVGIDKCVFFVRGVYFKNTFYKFVLSIGFFFR
jgi:hypothetical protein